MTQADATFIAQYISNLYTKLSQLKCKHNVINQTVCPEEVIKFYHDRRDPNNFMIHDDFELFKNPLKADQTGTYKVRLEGCT